MADLYFTKLYCAECGSGEVEVRMWVNPNTDEIGGDCNSPLEEEDCWCKNCEDHVLLKNLKELWNDFSAIPVNNDDEIEEDFLCFEKGASKFDVWHWFDERCPNNLHDDLMFNENTED